MYDYLAKVILLGPSGAGKSVSYPPTYPLSSNNIATTPLPNQTLNPTRLSV